MCNRESSQRYVPRWYWWTGPHDWHLRDCRGLGGTVPLLKLRRPTVEGMGWRERALDSLELSVNRVWRADQCCECDAVRESCMNSRTGWRDAVMHFPGLASPACSDDALRRRPASYARLIGPSGEASKKRAAEAVRARERVGSGRATTCCLPEATGRDIWKSAEADAHWLSGRAHGLMLSLGRGRVDKADET